MKAQNLVVRCFAERERDNTWFAICLDLNLYARGESFEEVKVKLTRLMRDYVKEALTNDAAYIGDLIPRRAPAFFWLRYACIWCVVKIREATDIRKFKLPLPLIPAY